MNNYQTKYGLLENIKILYSFNDGSPRVVNVMEENILDTIHGPLVPQYCDKDQRRKLRNSISFYKNGNIESLSVQDQTEIKTSIGILPAEFITFYDNGAIKRIFPLNGKLSAFWEEKEEYALAKPLMLNLPIGNYYTKILSAYFYPSGAIKSITLWPDDTLTIPSPLGEVTTRIGISFYEDGKLKSFEPNEPIEINTKIGKLISYDNFALTVNGDINSVSFSETSEITTLCTIDNTVKVINQHGYAELYTPTLRINTLDDETMVKVPLKIEFSNDLITFNSQHQFTPSICKFTIDEFQPDARISSPSCSSSCSSCNGCC
ncbi:hypothetical protein [Clostridium cellulovorans]|uniref:Uncharacterized protein n=1 Tax=Clostridium cellulovorans (strain ATCC 35296 / DSM 3052 / OCM 3 / 743B) TaxID=573061 RepID=D9SST0_CLOC7|nr:hypothetical protein [Clostridium cellulovorans]ADL52592.1 hypothetical protein Clocel_2897 [Clostridium cellulovorans 743B]